MDALREILVSVVSDPAVLVAWPVNVLLIRAGVKAGMGHPAEAHSHCH